MQALPREFYARNTVEVAQDLLGAFLVHKLADDLERVGRIVEVEAYLGAHDLAAHSSKGITNRTRVMFGPPGFAYVYLIYGMHHCMNVVTEPEGCGSAILIRALEPIRNLKGNSAGPGLLCRAMDIDRSLNGHDLCGGNFWIAAPPAERPLRIVQRPRIGIAYAGEWVDKPLRFYIEGNPYVSRK